MIIRPALGECLKKKRWILWLIARWVAISQGRGKFEKLIQLPAGDGTQVCFRDYAFHVAQDVGDWVMWRIVISFEKALPTKQVLGCSCSQEKENPLMKKLARFRVKELKDVLSQLGLAKQGRKQDLLDRIVALFSSNEEMQHSAKNISIEKEGISKIVDDVYRKLQGTGTTGSAMGGESDSNISSVITKEEAINPSHSLVLFPTFTFLFVVLLSMLTEFLLLVCQLVGLTPMIGFRIPKRLCSVSIMPYVEKEFRITRADINLLENKEYDVQVWCMLLNDTVPFRMQWPQFADLKISLCLVEGVNKISLSGSDARCFCLGVRVVKQHTVQEVLNLIPAEGDGEPFADALARVCRCIGGGMAKANDDSDSDLEVVADFVTVNLRCPMQDCGQDINEIDVKPDGSWRIKNGYQCMDLGQWHLPDGSPNVSAPEVDQNGSAEVKVCRSQDMQTLTCEYLEEENSENCGPEVITMSSGSSENVLDDGRGSINHRGSKHFDISAINGDEMNSRSYNFDQTSENANRSSSRSFVDADVVILSDSEEENVNLVSPRTISQTCPLGRGISYSFLDIFPEDMPLVAGTSSLLDPTENSGQEFKMRHQSFPYGTQTDTGFQLFGNAADVSGLLDGLEHTSVMSAAPRNGYTLSTSLSTDSGGLAVDFSNSHSTAGITESLVTNPVATAIVVPSEQASFQTQPAIMLQQSDVSCGLGSKTGGAGAPIESSNSTGVDLRNHSRSNTVVTVTADPSEQASFQTQPAKMLEQSDVSCGLGSKTGGAGAPIEPSTSTGVDLRNHSRSNRVSLGSTTDETRSNGATNRKRHDTLSLIHLYSLKVCSYVVTKYQNLLLSQISLFHLVPGETDRVSSLHGGFDPLDHPSGWRSKALFGRKAYDRQIVTAFRTIM
ncbi:hypothetical protein RJ640_002953 [Escallonia rubra]|uniref:SAP domain-containing protein n=1 Tax=Escallonia rubra TaxID=112253 RepID=A0AA88RWC7_9ASTE|nr:hypothetical protein RJ640_002953 [Escallonia rubra]